MNAREVGNTFAERLANMFSQQPEPLRGRMQDYAQRAFKRCFDEVTEGHALNGALLLQIMIDVSERVAARFDTEPDTIYMEIFYVTAPVWETLPIKSSGIPGHLEEAKQLLARFERAGSPSNSSSSASGYVYLLRGERGYYKIGHTKDPNNRLRTFEVKLPYEVEFEHLIPCRDRMQAEALLHRVFAHRRGNGEWFALTADDVTTIKAIKEL